MTSSSSGKGLTPRQLQIGELLAECLTVKAIARQTGLSIDTVHGHIQAAAERIGGSGPPSRRLALFVLRFAPAGVDEDDDY